MDSARNVVVESDETQGRRVRFGAPKGVGVPIANPVDDVAGAPKGVGVPVGPQGGDEFGAPKDVVVPVGAGPHPVGHAPAISPRLLSPMWLSGFILRIVVLILTLIGLALVASARDYDGIGRLRNTEKATDYSPYQYLIAVDVIVLVYSAVAAGLSMLKRLSLLNFPTLVLLISDVVCLVFLFSGTGSAAGTAVYQTRPFDYDDSSKKVTMCDSYKLYCDNLSAGIALSMFAAIAHFVIVILVIISSRRRSNVQTAT